MASAGINKYAMSDFYLACIEQAKEQSAYLLRTPFKAEEMFLDTFEHEYHNLIVNLAVIT